MTPLELPIAPDGETADDVAWPVVMFDDHGYPYVCPDGDVLASFLEGSTDEVGPVFDSRGRRCDLAFVDGVVMLRPGPFAHEDLVDAAALYLRLRPDERTSLLGDAPRVIELLAHEDRARSTRWWRRIRGRDADR